jgi:hypothetical protein
MGIHARAYAGVTEDVVLFWQCDVIDGCLGFGVQRTSFDEHGTPIRFTATVYPADRNQFEMEAGKLPEPLAPAVPSAGAKDRDGDSR